MAGEVSQTCCGMWSFGVAGEMSFGVAGVVSQTCGALV